MKILYIHDFNWHIGGAEVQFEKELALASRHVDAYRFSFTNQDELIEDDHQLLIPEKFPHRWLSHLQYHYFHPGVYRRLRAFIRRVQPDIIHIHNHNKYTNSILWACRGFKVVQTVHDFGLICPTAWCVTARDFQICFGKEGWKCYRQGCVPLYRLFTSHVLPRKIKTWLRQRIITGHITPSAKLKEFIERHSFPVIAVVNYIMEMPNPTFQPVTDFTNILYAGHLIPSKGVIYLVQAMPAIVARHPNATLHLLGSGHQEAELKRLVADLNLAGNVIFHGQVPNSRVIELFQQATVVVVPSIWMENNSVVIYEALAAGRPLLVSNRGGIPELVEVDGNGWLIEPGHATDIAEKLNRLLSDPETVQRFAQRSFELCRERYSEEAHWQKLQQIYETQLKSE